MKKKLIMGCLLVCLSFLLYPQIKLDIKTHFSEKYELKGLKFGIIFYLQNSGYKIVEIGENYAVWIEDYQEERIGVDEYQVKFKIDITPPTALLKKTSLASKDFDMNYQYFPSLLDVDETGFWKYVREKVKNIKEKDMVKAHVVGKKIAKDIQYLINVLKEDQKQKI
jgi:hypothetical protein